MSLKVGVLCHDGVGGSARVAVELGAALAQRGHEIHLFARRAPLGMSEPPQGVEFHTLDGGRGARRITPRLDADWSPEGIDALARRVASVGKAVGLDILHFHYAVPFAAVALRVERTLGSAAPALIGTLHGTDVSVLGRRPATRRELSAMLPGIDALTTVSHSHAELATRTFRLAEAPQVIPNFVDVDRFRPRPAGDPNPRPRVVHVSNFRQVKQPLAMARIFRTVRRTSDAELWLVGDGEGMAPVRSLLDRADLMGDTRLFGLRLDVDQILPEADVLLVTSRAESFCVAALEAAACGLPVVAPSVGGLPETVTDGQTGELYEPRDEAGAARALDRLLTNDEARALMGAAAVTHAHRLSTDEVVPRYVELYRDVLASHDLEVSPAA